MAQVPRNDGFSVMPSERAAFQGMQFIDPSVPRQEFDFNKAADRIDAFVERQDNARVDDAITKLKQYAIDQETGEQGFRNLKGEGALRPDEQGQGLVERTDATLRQTGDEIGMGLTSRQRRLFRQKAETIYQAQYGAVSQHVFQENRSWQENSRKGNIALSIEAGRTYFDRPDRLEMERQSVVANVRALGQLQGWGPAMTKAQTMKYTSEMYKGAIAGVLEKAEQNPAMAEMALGILDANKQHMLGTDVLEARKLINAHLDVMQADTVESEVVKNAFVDMDSGGYILLSTANGEALSPEQMADRARSMYIGTVTDALSGGLQMDGNTGKTAVNKRGDESTWQYGASRLTVPQAKKTAESLGEVFDAKRFMSDQGYNQRLGAERFSQLAQIYCGDVDKTMAAYYAGEQAVDKAIEKAKKSGNEGDWLSHLDTETQATVANLKKAIESSRRFEAKDKQGNAINPLTADYQDAKAGRQWVTEEQLRKRLLETDARSRIDPVWREKRMQGIRQRVAEQQRSYKQEQVNLTVQAQDVLIQANGDTSKIPRALWSQLDIDQQDALLKLGKKIADKDESTDDKVFYRLFANDVLLSSMTENELKSYRAVVAGTKWEALKKKYYELKEANRLTIDQRATEQGLARQGVIVGNYAKLGISEVRTALQNYIPHKEWEKLEDDPDRMNQMLAEAQMHIMIEGQSSGVNMQGKPGLIQQSLSKFMRNRVEVPGWFGKSTKPISQLVYDDLPNRGDTGAAVLITKMANDLVASEGHNRLATEGEKNEVLRRLFSQRDPGFVSYGGKLSGPLVDHITERYRKEYHRAPSTAELVRLYILAQVSDYQLPENEPSYATVGTIGEFTGDDFYGFYALGRE